MELLCRSKDQKEKSEFKQQARDLLGEFQAGLKGDKGELFTKSLIVENQLFLEDHQVKEAYLCLEQPANSQWSIFATSKFCERQAQILLYLTDSKLQL